MLRVVFDIDNSNKCIIQSNRMDEIRDHFSTKDPHSKIKQIRYGNFIPSRLYAITPTGRFELGMFNAIYQYCRTLDPDGSLIVTDKFRGAFNCGFDISEDEIVDLSMPLRDYQKSSVIKSLKFGHGVNIIATAGGKTLVMASIIQTIRKLNPISTTKHKTLVVVPGVQLVEQTYSDFLEYGIPKTHISKWSGKNKYQDTPIVVTSLNILQSKKTDLTPVKEADLFIIDEVHKFRKGNKSNNLFKLIKTKNKFGFTGTMPEEQIDQWNIIGKVGPILIEKTSKELRDDEYITKAKVNIVKINHRNTYIDSKDASIDDPSVKYNAECEHLYNNEFRNGIISKLSDRVDKNILILVDRIDHGLELKRMISEKSKKKVYFIQGSVDVDEREKIRSIMEKSNNVICIAMAAIFSTGINIKNLHYIMLAFLGKAKVRIIQAIGRGLRLHDDKDMFFIFDIADNFEYSEKHLYKRILLYNKEKIPHGTTEINERSI